MRLVTINILSDLSLWTQRRGLLVNNLQLLQPDVLILQEVRLDIDNAAWLANQLGYISLHQVPKVGQKLAHEGIAILSRIPMIDSIPFDLGSQDRVAQAVSLRVDEKLLWIVNGHFFWAPGDSEDRLIQVEKLIDWLKHLTNDEPVVIAGDFNGTPETRAIQRMKELFQSAYEIIHGKEPEWTAPTPLHRSLKSIFGTAIGYGKYIRRNWIKDFSLNWRGTLDYIWINSRVQVLDCQLVLNFPDPQNPQIFPSDHLGLCADLNII